MVDRTTKHLLALVILGVWGLLLRQVFTPVPTQAQTQSVGQNAIQLTVPVMQIHPTTGALYLALPDGNLFVFDPDTLKLRHRAVYTRWFERRSTAEDKAPTYHNTGP